MTALILCVGVGKCPVTSWQTTAVYPHKGTHKLCASGFIQPSQSTLSQGLELNKGHNPNLVSYFVTKNTSQSMFKTRFLKLLMLFISWQSVSGCCIGSVALGLASGFVSFALVLNSWRQLMIGPSDWRKPFLFCSSHPLSKS